jgi:REP element-mobilizing transposase RayT
MARLKRYHLPGALYHVMLRGNDGQDIFFSKSDMYNLCLLIQEGTERYGHRIHAFCFMKNHIHLLVQVAEISLSKIVHNLAFRYSQKINRKNKKIGHLFQGDLRLSLLTKVCISKGYYDIFT